MTSFVFDEENVDIEENAIEDEEKEEDSLVEVSQIGEGEEEEDKSDISDYLFVQSDRERIGEIIEILIKTAHFKAVVKILTFS